MSIIFDMSHLTKAINEANAKAGNKGPREEYTKTSYLPEGQHFVSLFFDPENHVFREVVYHKPEGSKVKCHCPNHLNKINSRNPKWAETVQAICPEYAERRLTQLPACEICAINDEAKQIDIDKYGDVKKGKSWKKKLGLNYNHLIYMNLYRTNNAGQYWEPNADKGTPYVVIGTSKLKTSILSLIETLSQTAGNYILKSLNPSIASPPFNISRLEGGLINISASPEDAKPAIVESVENAPQWWRPLRQVFLSENFSLEDYENVVQHAKTILDKYIEEESGKPNVPPTVTDSVDQKKSSEPIQLNLANASAPSTPKVVAPVVEEVAAKVSGELGPNQRMSAVGQIVDLPEIAIERNCWSKFDEGDITCVRCPVALECMLSKE